MPVLGGAVFIVALVVGFWRLFVGVNRKIAEALDVPTNLELGVRHVYDTEQLERELLEGVKPR